MIDDLQNKKNKAGREYKATTHIFSAIFRNKPQKMLLGIICNTVMKNAAEELQKVERLEVISKKENEAILILRADNYVINIFDFLPMKNELNDEKIKTSIYYYLESYKEEEEIVNIINDFNKHCEKMKELLKQSKNKIKNFDNLNSVKTSILANLIYNKNIFELVSKNNLLLVSSIYKKKV